MLFSKAASVFPVLSLLLVSLGFSLVTLKLSAEVPQIQEQVFGVFNKNQDAIVRVKAAFKQDLVEGKPSQINLRVGTGFFVSQEGHALVSASRAIGADRIAVEFKDVSYPAEAIGHDPSTNISLIRLLKLPPKFGFIRVLSDVAPRAIGTMILSIACPLDFDPSPEIGMVSGLDKNLGDQIFPTTYMRTTIPVGIGQGGCPILDMDGQLVGMSIASIPDINGSYCLPTAALFRVKEDLMHSGKSERGWLGIEVKENATSSAEHNVYISGTHKDGPADIAGLKEGDQIISICGVMIKGITDLPSAIFKTRENQLASMRIIRGKKELELSIKAQVAPGKKASE